MDELLKQLKAARIRCLLAGGQAMRLSGMPSVDDAERLAVIRQTESGTPIPCLSGPHLLAAKRAANRPQDQADIEFLTELERLGKL